MNNNSSIETQDLKTIALENVIVQSMFDTLPGSIQPLETFSTWLLVCTGTVASFLIANAENVLPYISKSGFLVGGILLCMSCLFGLLSKMYAVRCEICVRAKNAALEATKNHLLAFQQQVNELKQLDPSATYQQNLSLDVERIRDNFLAHFPNWVQKRARKKLNANKDHNNIGHKMIAKNICYQSIFASLQSVFFLAFLACSFIFAATT